MHHLCIWLLHHSHRSLRLRRLYIIPRMHWESGSRDLFGLNGHVLHFLPHPSSQRGLPIVSHQLRMAVQRRLLQHGHSVCCMHLIVPAGTVPFCLHAHCELCLHRLHQQARPRLVLHGPVEQLGRVQLPLEVQRWVHP